MDATYWTDDSSVADRELDALLELSSALGQTGGIDSALFGITNMLANRFRCDRCSVLILDRDRNSAVVISTSDDPNIRRLQIDISAYPEISEVVRTTQPLVVTNVEDDPIFDAVREKIRNKGLGSAILFPVTVDDEVQGVLHLRVGHPRTEALDPRELRFGRIVANATGISIRNARLFERVRQAGAREISARMRVERRLQQIEKYQRFFDLAGDGLMIVDGTGRILFANRAARVMLGFSETDLTKVRLSDLVADSGRTLLQKIMDGINQARCEPSCELPVIRASGEVAILSLTTAALEEPSSQGELEARSPRETTAIVSFRDVTETQRIQEELRRTKDFLMSLIDSSADAIVAADMSGRMMIFNPVAQKITGYTQEEAEQVHVSQLYMDGVARRIMTDLRSADYGGRGKLESSRQIMLTKSGEEVPVNLAASIVYDQGRERATVGIFSDLRERISMEQQLETALKQAVMIKTAGAAAHELNQPLTSIMGYAELVTRKLEESSSLRVYTERIVNEADRMAQIVSKLGQIARYRTKPYVGTTDILDLDAASGDESR